MRLFDSSSHDLDSNVLHDVRRAAWLPHVNLRELQLGRDGALAHLEAVLAGGSGDPERSVYGPTAHTPAPSGPNECLVVHNLEEKLKKNAGGRSWPHLS
jgi:hypothetical protein